jgi:putative tryptophan/tyrosine transport system substrate-binding protein
MNRRATSSLPGLTRQSILLRKKMDARVKPAHDELRTDTPLFFGRRVFITLLAGAAAWPLSARAQQKLARVGFFRQAAPHEKQFEAFRGGLRAAGYLEGQNIVIEQRYAAGNYDRLSDLATELVRANVEVIVVDGTAAAKACKSATATIPIVFALAVDPVADGLAASFARPGGNLTGLTMAAGYVLAGKRVELLKDMVGSLSRVAVLSNPGNPPHVPYLRETERAASALGLTMQAFEVRSPNELPGAFAAMADWHADGLVTLTDGMLFSNRDRIAALALASKLPAVYPEAEFVAAGGLSSYGPSLPDLFRRAAGYVEKILKGAKPGDLPIEQPTKFELVINLKTAQTLGLSISREFQLRADEVIE